MHLRSIAIKNSIIQTLRYYHVGRKHIQQVSYNYDQCTAFNLLLASQIPEAQTQTRRLSSKAVNRLFVSCLFSRIIGNNFPLSIYLSQSIDYKKDVAIDQQVIGEIEVIKDLGKKKYEIKTVCKSLQGQILVDGIAIILQE